jgi:hypothetical protein
MTTAHTYTVKGGSLTVAPIAAIDQMAFQDNWTDAALNISGTVTIRKVDYTVNVDYRWCRDERPVYIEGRETSTMTRWQRDRHGNGQGYRRTDTNAAAPNGTATADTLDTLVEQALKQFDAEEPDWRRESYRLRLAKMIEIEEKEAAYHRGVVAQHEATAAKIRAQRDAL